MSTVTPRAFLQERLALFGRTGFFVSASFLAVFNLAEMLAAANRSLGWVVTNRSNEFHLGLSLVFLAVWLSCRKRERSERALAVIEFGGVLLAGLACTLPVRWATLDEGRIHSMFLEITQILVARAIIVPSTARRTIWLSASVVLPATLMVFLFHLQYATSVLGIVKPTLEAALFCAMAVVLAALASHVIYGLREEVRAARKLGQYTLQEQLGAGGMGIVYRAQHAMLRRPTAIKLLPPDRAGENSIRRFEREVQITSQLAHPNTVSVYDYGRTPDGIFYYAMELLDGVTLGQLVGEYGPQPPARVVHILKQVCGSLSEAHALGLVHRDIKPANVILCERWGAADVVKVLDFGLVKDLARSSDASVGNMVAGTPQYISPEAVLTPEKVGPSADIYAVGAVGYFLLTGTHVFEGATLAEIIGQHLDRRPTSPSERLGRAVPPELEAVILECLAKEPARRPRGAHALAAALDAGPDAQPWTSDQAHAWWKHRRATGRPLPKDAPSAFGLTDPSSKMRSSAELPTVIRNASSGP